MKLKGIDGGPHKQWIMWFNSKQREEPYQHLTSTLVERGAAVMVADDEARGRLVDEALALMADPEKRASLAANAAAMALRYSDNIIVDHIYQLLDTKK